ncbi:ribonuclease H-like domain-containing protein [Tanacetum coccineum]
MDLETAQTTIIAKLPILKQGDYDMWRLRIEQYFQVQDYAIWDVIENGKSFKPAVQTTTNAEGTLTTLTPGPVTADEKIQKKNDVKVRSMLLMILPNEHLMTFNHYKDAKTLFGAIETRFGGNEATKKTQKTLLKQMYENFNAPSIESLDSIFNRLQKITQSDLDTVSFDDLYNNFKIVKQEVKGTANSSSSSQNMAFLSSPNSTNDVNTAYGVSTDNTQVNDLEEMDLKWKLALLSIRTRRVFQKTGRKITINGSDTAVYDKSKVEYFNCHKLGHFARECRGSRNQDSRNRNQDNSRRTINMEETSSKAMLAIGGAGFDWSYMTDDELDLSNSGLEKFQQPEFEGYGPKTSNNVSNEVKESPNAPLVEELLSNDKLEKKTVFPTVAKIEFVKPKQQEKPVRKPVKYAEMYSFDHVQANCNYHQRERMVSGNSYTRVNYNYSTKQAHPSAHRNMAPRAVLMKTGLRPLNTARPVNTAPPKTIVYSARPMSRFSKSAQSTGHPQKEDQGYVDSRCSRHMTGNMSYLSDFKEFDKGYVTFRGGAKGEKIISKGTLKIGKLDFENVYFVKELQFDLLSVS